MPNTWPALAFVCREAQVVVGVILNDHNVPVAANAVQLLLAFCGHYNGCGVLPCWDSV